MLGIIGGNGAGKSTLLRLCGGVLRPTEGVVQRTGRAEAFFDFTAGLQPDLTCQDNVILGLIISGHSVREARSLVQEVLEFAGIWDNRLNPVRVLSTGMKLRLGFAIATQQRPDLLLLDEVVSVGDADFQERSSDRTAAFLRAGTAAVLVSHDMQQVQSLCQRAIWIHHGQSASYGSADVVTKAYIESAYDVDNSNSGTGITGHEPPGMQLATIVNGNPDTATVTSGASIELGFEINVDQALGVFRPAISLLDDNGQLQTYLYYQSTIEHDGGRLSFSVTLDKMGLADGDYQIALYLHSADWSTTLGEFADAASIEIENAPEGAGVLRPQSEWCVPNK
ncbi:MAG: ATP-binding cassette domain-containing protein [Gammaproteobacteria bacterium]|nr:ATP-binding cassette domain-containing protein [Gammaproteobacteria bacterium]MBU2676734.1 ATP-binding cassette domain-containing protein [Gammaproteobacteria bacterium]NNC57826.1 ATP-binding cassette domain-containing protein [Woeseiaceae bacterium]NNL50469.1 ATP-binding cassette domain-containing protein [Woeseiaceae bacterium]